MKYLIIILLISCQVIPKDVGKGHIHEKGDTIQVCFNDNSELWKVRNIRSGVIILEPIHNKRVVGNGKLEINGKKAIYRYGFIPEAGYYESIYVVFGIETP